MRNLSTLLVLAGALTLSACTAAGEPQEESPVGPGDSTVQDVGDTDCLVGKWSMDVQAYAESALETQLTGQPVSNPIGGGSRVLNFTPNGLFTLDSTDFTLTYTISAGGVEITPTFTTNESYSGEWGWAGDAERDELEFGEVGAVGDPTVTATDPTGAPLPGVDPVPTPVIAEDIPIGAVCDARTLMIDGPVPSIWFRLD